MRYLNCRIADDGTPEWGLEPPAQDPSPITCYVPLTRFYPAYCETLANLQQRNPDMPSAVATDLALDRLWERREELQAEASTPMADVQETPQVSCLSLELLRTAKDRLETERREIVKRLATDGFRDTRDTLASLASTLSDLQEALFILSDMIGEQEAQG